MRKLVRRIKNWYEGGNWTQEQVDLALQKEKITQEEYAIIVGGDERIEESQGEA